MKFDIIIATYNRPEKICQLARQFTECSLLLHSIIIVDSSDIVNQEVREIESVRYIRSSHKNQPYQRYLGYLAAESDYLVFLDDDMELIDNFILARLKKNFEEKDIVAQNILWHNKPNEKNSLIKISGEKQRKSSAIKKMLTFYPNPKIGRLGHCGIRGNYPPEEGYIEFLSGGAFSVKRSFIFKSFNFQLFHLFEQKIGMGEDSIIGFSMTQFGKIYFENKLSFWHNDQGHSTYIINSEDFSKRIIFSRKFLTLERLRIIKKGLFWGKLYFQLYTIFRLIPVVIQIPRKNKNKEVAKGIIKGLKAANLFNFHYKQEDENYWLQEALKDLEKK